MTVSYTADVATVGYFSCFFKLLFRWRASIYKLIICDLIVYLALYFTLSFIYRFALYEKQKIIFENVAMYCNKYMSLIPLSFVLGSFVSLVCKRWWEQYCAIPWPDPIAVYLTCTLIGQDERGRMMRRTIMRYVCLSITILLTMVSPKAKKRFPTTDHLVEAGLLVESENQVYKTLDTEFPNLPKHLLPLVWAASILQRARKEGRIRDDYSFKMLFDKINDFRDVSLLLTHYDTISIPLIYTQVVTLAVYTYFLSDLMGGQWLEGEKNETKMVITDIYVPVFLILRFIFFMGWLKVAECMINPFGDDDDDFDINWIMDRNLKICYLIVDEMHHDHPKLVRDQYWDEIWPVELPYPEEQELMREKPPEPSTAKFEAKTEAKSDNDDDIRSTNSQKSDAYFKWKRANEFAFTSSESLFDQKKDERDQNEAQDAEQPGAATTTPLPVTAKGKPREKAEEKSIGTQSSETSISSVLLRRHTRSSDITTSFQASKSSRAEDMSTVDEEDDFEKLRGERERERTERQKRKLLKNLNTIVSATNELPIDPIMKSSLKGIISKMTLEQNVGVSIDLETQEQKQESDQKLEEETIVEQALRRQPSVYSVESVSSYDLDNENQHGNWGRFGGRAIKIDSEETEIVQPKPLRRSRKLSLASLIRKKKNLPQEPKDEEQYDQELPGPSTAGTLRANEQRSKRKVQLKTPPKSEKQNKRDKTDDETSESDENYK